MSRLASLALALLALVPAAIAQDRAPAAPPLPDGEGVAVIRGKCLGCHGPELIQGQRLTAAGWGRELDKMTGWGAVLDDAERRQAVDYLARHFGAGTPAAPPPNAEAAATLKARCQVCHDDALIRQQRLTRTGWSRELDKMIGWGATLDEREKTLLLDYLAGRGE